MKVLGAVPVITALGTYRRLVTSPWIMLAVKFEFSLHDVDNEMQTSSDILVSFQQDCHGMRKAFSSVQGRFYR